LAAAVSPKTGVEYSFVVIAIAICCNKCMLFWVRRDVLSGGLW